jgi:hypothetical protein
MNQMIADPSEYLSNSNRVFRTTQDQMRYLTERGQELLTKQQSITGALDLLRRGKAQAYLVDLVTTLPAKDATSI